MALLNVRSLTNKTFILNDFILSADLDFMFLTETWLQPTDCSQLVEACPPHSECFNQPRVSGRGGGIACVYRKNFNCQLVHFNEFSSFEALTFKLTGSQSILFAIIYRPPKPPGRFLAEFPEFLSSLVLNHDRVVLCGDFSLHVDDSTNSQAADLLNISSSFNFEQHACGPTHNRVHTLDLVFTLGIILSSLNFMHFIVSDHKCIVFNSECPVFNTAAPRSWSTRIYNENSAAEFCKLFNNNCRQPAEHAGTNDLTDYFNSAFLSTIDVIAPLKLRTKSSVKK